MAEMTLKMNAFDSLTMDEMMAVDGGSRAAAAGVLIIGGAVIAGILAPITCGGSLGIYVAGAAVGYGVMLNGIQIACGG